MSIELTNEKNNENEKSWEGINRKNCSLNYH